MSLPSEILSSYLSRIGLTRPTDAAQQFSITLLRQWLEHLDYVLEKEEIELDRRRHILYAMMFGGAPSLFEAEIRGQMATQMTEMTARQQREGMR